MIRLRCWWFGHEQHSQDSAPPDSASCMHCGEHVPYSDMVGDTRHVRMMYRLRYMAFRFWWPAKCSECGRRYGHTKDCDEIPF